MVSGKPDAYDDEKVVLSRNHGYGEKTLTITGNSKVRLEFVEIRCESEGAVYELRIPKLCLDTMC